MLNYCLYFKFSTIVLAGPCNAEHLIVSLIADTVVSLIPVLLRLLLLHLILSTVILLLLLIQEGLLSVTGENMCFV